MKTLLSKIVDVLHQIASSITMSLAFTFFTANKPFVGIVCLLLEAILMFAYND
jgi:hypothetical protein